MDRARRKPVPGPTTDRCTPPSIEPTARPPTPTSAGESVAVDAEPNFESASGMSAPFWSFPYAPLPSAFKTYAGPQQEATAICGPLLPGKITGCVFVPDPTVGNSSVSSIAALIGHPGK